MPIVTIFACPGCGLNVQSHDTRMIRRIHDGGVKAGTGRVEAGVAAQYLDGKD
jgi:hypothetical protein